MSFKILVMGLSGSGKTTLAEQLCESLGAEHLNADSIREEYKDWDFSESGRLRQAERMKELAEKSSNKYVVMDFICPLDKGREIINADYTIWMDTIKSCKYQDTNIAFNSPKNAHKITNFDYNVNNLIKNLTLGKGVIFTVGGEEIKIKEGFISKAECADILLWVEECRYLLNPNPVSENRFFNNLNNLPSNTLVKAIQQKVLAEYGLSDVEREDGFLGSILSYQTEGAFVHHHTDTIEGKRHLRFNLFLSVPESGGVPIYNGEEMPIKERMLIPYEADKYLHSSTPVVGNKPRIIISFGWAFDGL